MDALQHSFTAGISFFCPPVYAIEIYRAAESFKEAAIEYNKGIEKQKQEGK